MYKEIKKTKISKIILFSILVPAYLILFVIFFGICVLTHIKYIGDEPTTLLGTVFVFSVPAILTILSIYIISIFIFSKHYINKIELSKIKDSLAHISVFTIIFVNTIEKFYSPGRDVTEETKNYNWFFKQVFDFVFSSIQTINFTYTLPLLFSMMTLILLALEHSKFVTKRTKRVMMYPFSYPSYNPANIERARQLANEIDNNRKKQSLFTTIL